MPSTTSPSAAETRAAPISTQITRLLNCPARSASGETVCPLRSSLGPIVLQALRRLRRGETMLYIRAELCRECWDRLVMPARACVMRHWGCAPVITAVVPWLRSRPDA